MANKKQAVGPGKGAIKKFIGRPRTEIDFDLLAQLCMQQNTLKDICKIMRVSEDTIQRRIADVTGGGTFTDYSEHYRSFGRSSLRRAQFRTALNGNARMQVWLGKNWLGQSEDGLVDPGDGGEIPDEFL